MISAIGRLCREAALTGTRSQLCRREADLAGTRSQHVRHEKHQKKTPPRRDFNRRNPIGQAQRFLGSDSLCPSDHFK
jgi:hypothetical protein